MTNLTKLAALSGMMLFGTGLAQAANITGTISSTLTITTDSKLTGNVTCTVKGAPCIVFGATGIRLDLNGFTITGNGYQDSCTLNPGETGIDTNSRSYVAIRGPGLVRRFNGNSIVVSGSHSSVKGIAVTSSCIQSIVVGGSDNNVEKNSLSRASLGSPAGYAYAAIFVSGSGGHRIRHNEVVGAGPWPTTSSQYGFGIFVGEVGTPSNDNLIEENNASGNPQAGIYISAGSVGNTVRDNQALGNRYLSGTGVSDDIYDANALPANTYRNNLCEESQIGPSLQNICELPDIAGHSNPRLE